MGSGCGWDGRYGSCAAVVSDRAGPRRRDGGGGGEYDLEE